ncbi:hypothetical protein DFS34DRAFT_603819, partial [Phlyctochytrium arcticum]
MVDCGRLFTLAAIIAWTDHNGRAPIALLREWLVRVRVEARMREMAAVGFDFFSAPYVPEPNPLNPELPLVIAVDPDHVLKRWMKHLTTSGFGNFINKAAWEKIASDPRNDAVMGLWWWNRDSQNVADAKDGCSAAVEKLLLEAGCPEEALLCRLLREAFESFDKSGLSEEERVARINRLLAWLTPKVCGFFYNEPCSSHLPQIPYHLRQVTPRPQTDYQPDTCLPIELIEATLSLCYGRMAIVQYLESHPQNIIYQQQLSSSPPSAHIPLFNDRWRQSNDVENLFSQLKANLGKAGRARLIKHFHPKPLGPCAISNFCKVWTCKKMVRWATRDPAGGAMPTNRKSFARVSVGWASGTLAKQARSHEKLIPWPESASAMTILQLHANAPGIIIKFLLMLLVALDLPLCRLN